MNNKNLETESGRSMVEMLGVLAVIGVLTVIGITGFRYAMNKHYANQTVNRLMKRAVVVAAQANFGQTLSLHEFDPNDGEYPIPNPDTLEHNAESFTLTVNEVPQEVCQQIVGLDWKIAKIIPTDCSDTTMKFMFLNDLTDCSTCQPDTFPCEDYGKECGKCSVVKGFFANEGNQCTNNEKPYCVLGKCETCPAEETTYNNSCKACSQINSLTFDNGDDCHKCVDAQGKHTHFFLPSYGDRCMKCSDSEWSAVFATTLEECNLCKNRCFNQANNTCGIPGTRNKADFTGYVRDNATGYCKCAEGYYLAKERPNDPEYCRSCDEINSRITSADDCHRCIDANGKHTHFFLPSYENRCMKCSEPDWSGVFATTLEECNLCENRCFRSDLNACGIPGTKHRSNDFTGYVRDDATGLCVPAS